MAIQNASDLLIYRKSPSGVKQVTKISCLTTAPYDVLGDGVLNITNATSATGNNVANSPTTTNASDTGGAIRQEILAILNNTPYSYTYVSTVEGDYTVVTVTNYIEGDCETLDVVSGLGAGNGVLKEGAIIIEVLTSGETADAYEPVAFSTSASFSVSRELRDKTNKDSLGFAEHLPGLKSFEMSTDALQDFNADLDFEEFFNDIGTTTPVIIRFAQRDTGGSSDLYYEGSAFITTVSMDAGVEENATYSASFTGTAAVTTGTD